MKREKKRNDIHTNTKDFSISFKIMRGALKVLGFIAPSIAVRLVTKLFRKPIRKKIHKKQALFYKNGITDSLRIRGHTIKVFKKGSGNTVYVSHGWGSYGYDMKNIIAILVREGYRVIIPDLPCHGRSSGKFIDQIEMSKVITALLLHYNAQSPVNHIVTHSWGGTVSLLALDRIRKNNPEKLNIHSMVSISMPSHLNAIMDIFCNALNLSKTVKNGLMLNLKKIAQKDRVTMEEAFPMGLTDLLDNPHFNYLLIHGKKYNAVSYSNSIRLAGKFPHINLQLKDGLGHIDILADKTVHTTIIEHLMISVNQPDPVTAT